MWQYYITEKGILKGLEPNTANIVTIIQTNNEQSIDNDLDSLILQKEENNENFQKITNIYFVGKFIKFDNKTRLLETSSGKQILLPINQIEKSKFLVENTKKYLSKLV